MHSCLRSEIDYFNWYILGAFDRENQSFRSDQICAAVSAYKMLGRISVKTELRIQLTTRSLQHCHLEMPSFFFGLVSDPSTKPNLFLAWSVIVTARLYEPYLSPVNKGVTRTIEILSEWWITQGFVFEVVVEWLVMGEFSEEGTRIVGVGIINMVIDENKGVDEEEKKQSDGY